MALSSASCAITTDGDAWCWGSNYDGQLATGDTWSVATPQPLEGLPPVATISTHSTSCALTTERKVWCWGDNRYGGAGTGETADDPVLPAEVPGIDNATAIATGSGFACALLDDGTVKCWGSNLTGELGDGTAQDRYTPVRSQVRDAVMVSSPGLRDVRRGRGGSPLLLGRRRQR